MNGSDYTLIDNALNSQGAQLTSMLVDPNAISTAQIVASISPVPEPTIGAIVLQHVHRSFAPGAG